MGPSSAVIVLARDPFAGRAKTRLSASIGKEAASSIYRCFVEDTLHTVSVQRDVAVFVAWGDSVPPADWAQQHCPGARPFLQDAGDLGQRIAAALSHVAEEGYKSAVVIGSDSPSLPPSRIARGLAALGSADLVLGPTRDGGCYLIGGNQRAAAAFDGVAWSTSDVFGRLCQNARRLGLRRVLLPSWYDVDTVEDLSFLHAHIQARKLRGVSALCPVTSAALRERADSLQGSACILELLAVRRVAVVIPALDEEDSIGQVLNDIPDSVTEVIVVDNGCSDRTPEIAAEHGACVVKEPERGYGAACLRGIHAAAAADIIVFLDADYSDRPAEMERLLAPIIAEEADLVIGSRMLGERAPGALPPHARFGNWLAGRMLRLLHGQPTTDLGPFRAIRADALMELDMQDRAFGWTMEMQAKAARARLRVVEVPVSYHKRVGRSKITGTLRGSFAAGRAIIGMALRTVRWKPDSLG